MRLARIRQQEHGPGLITIDSIVQAKVGFFDRTVCPVWRCLCVTAQWNNRVIIIIEVLTANFLCFRMVERAINIEQHILPFIDESTSRYAYIIKKTIVNFIVKINQTHIEILSTHCPVLAEISLKAALTCFYGSVS